MQDFRPIFFICILIFVFFFSNDVEIPENEKNALIRYNLEREKAREFLYNTTYTQGYGNLTGFRLSYSDAVAGRNVSDYPFPDKDYSHFEENEEYLVLPNDVSSKAKDVWNTRVHGHILRNLTSKFRGTLRHPTNYTPIPMPFPDYLADLNYRFPWQDGEEDGDISSMNNVTRFDDGLGFSEDWDASDYKLLDEIEPYEPIKVAKNATCDFSLSIIADASYDTIPDVIPLKLTLRIEDSDEKFSQTPMHGLYFHSSGTVFGASSSPKFESIYAAPHLLLDEEHFAIAKEFYLTQKNYTKPQNLTYSQLQKAVFNSDSCEFITYFALEPMNFLNTQLEMIDSEISEPLGRPIPSIPKFNLSRGVLYSPNCGVRFEMEAAGETHARYVARVRHMIVGLILVCLAQLYLVIRQMNLTDLVVSVGRLLYYTAFTFALVDAMLIFLLLGSLEFADVYITLLVAICIAVILSWGFESRYAISIYMAQRNERGVDLWTALRGVPEPELPTSEPPRENQTQETNEGGGTGGGVGAGGGGGPPEQTAPGVYMLYFFLFFMAYFYLEMVSLWRKGPREIAEGILFLLINSYWYPQIFRNVIRGTRTAFSWEFMIGVSIVRLIPMYYLYGVRNNVFFHGTNYAYLAFLTLYVAFSLVVLYAQERFGPRALVPKLWLPTVYSYPLLTVEDVEGDLLKDKRKSAVMKDGRVEKEVYKVDCAICFNEVEIPVVYEYKDADSGSDLEGLLGEHYKKTVLKGDYMLTPCGHIFHAKCLESWMRYKLQCPICRNGLPPV